MTKPQCRVCGAEQDKQTVRAEHVYGSRGQHNFWQCARCELVYLFPVPTEQEEQFFYEQEFEKFMSARAAQDRDWTGAEAHIKSNQDHVKRRWEFIKQYAQPGKDILEVGCSSGFMMDDFKQKGLNPIGVEPSNKFLDFLKSRGHTAYPSMDALKTEKPEQKYDLIVHFFVLEHIRNTSVFLQEQIDLLKPGGVIIAEIPCVTDPLTSLYDIPAFEKFYWSIAHHYYFSPKSLSYILDRMGCKYKLLPDQRYDLSNHITWLMDGKPGGQGRYGNIFSEETIASYKKDLKDNWLCDTIFMYIFK